MPEACLRHDGEGLGWGEPTRGTVSVADGLGYTHGKRRSCVDPPTPNPSPRGGGESGRRLRSCAACQAGGMVQPWLSCCSTSPRWGSASSAFDRRPRTSKNVPEREP